MGTEGMTRDEIKDIRDGLRGCLDVLDELDGVEAWGREERREALDMLSEIGHYTERQKMYYKQYRGLMKD